jgi:hypothetical protein
MYMGLIVLGDAGVFSLMLLRFSHETDIDQIPPELIEA